MACPPGAYGRARVSGLYLAALSLLAAESALSAAGL
jgi:hypothetical protein